MYIKRPTYAANNFPFTSQALCNVALNRGRWLWYHTITPNAVPARWCHLCKKMFPRCCPNSHPCDGQGELEDVEPNVEGCWGGRQSRQWRGGRDELSIEPLTVGSSKFLCKSFRSHSQLTHTWPSQWRHGSLTWPSGPPSLPKVAPPCQNLIPLCVVALGSLKGYCQYDTSFHYIKNNVDGSLRKPQKMMLKQPQQEVRIW